MGDPAELMATPASDADESLLDLDSEATPLDTLPPPPRRARSVTLAFMAVTALVAGVLAWQLRGEALYALEEQQAVELGSLADASLDDGHANSYARATVDVKPGPGVRFRRLLDQDDYRVAALAEQGGARRWVAYRVPPKVSGPRFVPPSLVAGRLTRVSDLGARYRGLQAALERASGSSEAQGWVLIDGQDPQGAGWLLGLAVMLLGLVGWNLIAAIRILRKPASKLH